MSLAYIRQSTLLLLTFTEPEAFLKISGKSFKNNYLYKKSMKAYFKLQNCLSSTNRSIDTFLHLYDHTIKPILTYGSEIWGMFSVDSKLQRNI
jgi:hypothetical protein